MAAKFPATKFKDRIKLYRNPACLVAPVFKQWFPGTQQHLCQLGIETLETGKQYDCMASGAGDGHGVELKKTETPDNLVRCFTGSQRKACRALGKAGPFGFEKSGPDERQSAGFGNFNRFH